MGKKEDDLSDILGGESQEDRKTAKSARLKALTPKTKEKEMAKAKEEGKPARAVKDAKGAKAPAKEAKSKKESSGEAVTRPTVAQREEIQKKIVAKIKKPMTCSEADELLGVPGGWTRQAARALVAEGKYFLKKGDNGRLTIGPGKK